VAKAGENPSEDADALLKRMAAAYQKASSYADFATVRLHAETAKGAIDQTAKFGMTLVRPNKLRMECYQGTIVCDGKQWYAFVEGLPNQVVLRDAPAKVTMDTIHVDDILRAALSRGFAGPCPQSLLLLDADALPAFLDGVKKVSLADPETIDGHDCYQVRAERSDGTATFWVDQKTYALRRMALPVDEFRKDLERDGEVKSVSLVADFKNAQFDSPIDPKAFEFAVPDGAQRVKFFMDRGPYELVGKVVPNFKFVDLKGNAVTRESLAGKVAVLVLWEAGDEPSKATLPLLEQVWQKYKDNAKVAVYCVNLDPPALDNKSLQKLLQEWQVSVPVLREREQGDRRDLKIIAPLTTLLLGPDGMLQDCEMGPNPNLALTLPQKIGRLLASEDLAKDALAQLGQRLKIYDQSIDEVFQGKVSQPLRAKVETKSEPKTLRLAGLWKCTDLKLPGNILVVPQAKGPPRLFVVEELKSIVELGMDGKVLATYKPDLESYDPQQQELICALRTATAADGKRTFAAFAMGHQRVHVFDENWKPLVRYPENAIKNRHSGIADVQLGDIEGDGTTKLYVGYWGVVGVQEASLKGERTRFNQSLANVSHIAFGLPDAKGVRELFCTNESGSIAAVAASSADPQDKKLLVRTITVPGEFIEKIAAADLNGDGRLLWCAISHSPDGEIAALGLKFQGDKGEVLWKYPLPKGQLQQPVEPIIAGRVTSGGAGQWILPGCDGSVHVLSADGKLIDRFNYGTVLCGLATTEVDGKPVLLISSQTGGVEASRVEH
jgi:outer membrane lipoprotein-sorting protein